jgi:hypothetical protein
MTDEQRTTLDPQSQEYRFRALGSKTHVVGWFTYTTPMWLLKACWIVYYSRLTYVPLKIRVLPSNPSIRPSHYNTGLTEGAPYSESLGNYGLRIRTGYLLIAGTYIAAILLIVFKCSPLRKQWQIFPAPGSK